MDWEQEAFAEPGRHALKQLLEGAMKAEVVGYLQRQRYERGKVVVDYRNGYYHRSLVTSLGLITRLVVPRPRCWVHKLRNVTGYLPRRYQPDCLRDAKRIYLATNYRQAVQRFKVWCRKWRGQLPKAVQCLEKDIEDMLVFLKEDKKLWVKVRTTNVIERLFKELRKRTRPMSLFANVESCDRILYCLVKKCNTKWEDRRYAIF